MLTLYGVYRSRATRNFWLLEELGLPFRYQPVIQAYRLPDPAAADAPMHTRSPGFLALSPAGAVPVLDDDGFVLSESLAINLYLARKAGGPLAPATPQEDAAMQQWALYGATVIEAPALVISYAFAQERADTPEGRAEIAGAEAQLDRPLSVLEAHLKQQADATGTAWMVGNRFTVADINMAEILRYAQPDTALMARFAGIGSWLTACQARPAFHRMWAARLAEPA